MTRQDIDIADPDVYTNGVPHEVFERLRREAPVSWHENDAGLRFWAVTKHKDVVVVSRDAERFSSELGGTQLGDLPKGDPRMSPNNLAVMDPPRHTQFRALIGQSFTINTVSRLEPYIQQLVSNLVDELLARKEFEFMEDFAGQLPMSIILKMVGVPTQDQAMLKDWVLQILASDDPEYAKNGGDVIATTGRFMQYAHMLAAERSKSPQDDLLSQLMAAKVNGVKLTYDEFGMFFILLLGAGTHTTQLLLGNAALALMENPAQRQRLVRDPALVQSGVEEVLRFSPPFIHFRRTARIDTELGGQQIRAGDKVVVWYVSANRDEDVFPEPNSFDVGRSPNDHLSFGYGPHFCLGNALGRLTAKTALAECVRRMPEMAPNGPRVRLRSNWFNGLKRLPVVAG